MQHFKMPSPALLVQLLVISTAFLTEVGGVLLNNGQHLAPTNAGQLLTIQNDLGSKKKTSPVICLTPGCTLLAAQMLNSMDVTVNPCDDFYQYTCGKYIATRTMPDDQVEYGLFQDLNDKMDIKLKRELERSLTDTERSKESQTVKKLRIVYAACTNTTEIDRRNVKPALELLDTLNKWPVINKNFEDSTFDFEQAIANIARHQKSTLISVQVSIDYKNSTKYGLTIDQPELGMPSRDYYSMENTSNVQQAYYQYMTAVASALQQEVNTNSSTDKKLDEEFAQLLLLTDKDRMDSKLLDVLQFEIRLAAITTPKETRRDPLHMYNPMSIRQLSKLAPEIDWLRILSLYLSGSGNTVDENEVVVVAEPQYLAKLMQLIKETPARVVANYLGWRTIEPFVSHINGGEELKAARLRYTKALSGQAKNPERWKTCLAAAKTTVIIGVSRLYVEKFFDSASKTLADNLIVGVQEAFELELASLDWLGERERLLSIEKMQSMLRLIAYDDRWLNNTWLDERYSLYVGEVDKHFENMVDNARANDALMQLRLRKPVDRQQWDDQTVAVNANYNPNINRIMFLAGMLQPPFFDRDQPMAANFGAVGICMGHEITHGFDDQGRNFDKNGLLSNWWGPETTANFKRRAQCIVDFYSNYSVPETGGAFVNGNFTLGENLADLGGTRLSYRAFQNWKTKNQIQADVRLPGLLDFTSEQVFFLSGGLFWCDYKRPETQKQRILTDEHSPQRFRVLGEFSNFPEFSRAFNCPLGSNMNPVKKCQVW